MFKFVIIDSDVAFFGIFDPLLSASTFSSGQIALYN